MSYSERAGTPSSSPKAEYESYMERAIELARRGRWHAAPNPCVGAVLVQNGHIVAEGWHKHYGGKHAEIECLDDARQKGVDPRGCTMAVTLEPCAHYGKTPPCAKALIGAGIQRVIIGMPDPHLEASGGAQLLRAAGIEVISGIKDSECRLLTDDFLVWTCRHRPYVIVKMASSLDGRTGPRDHGRWSISGTGSHAGLMELRSRVAISGGLILIGGNTFYTDDPKLTARGVNASRQPIAGIVVSALPEHPEAFHLTRERPQDTIFFCPEEASYGPKAEALKEMGVRIFPVPKTGGKNDLAEILRICLDILKAPYVLCEGGPSLAGSFLEKGLADLVLLYQAPMLFADSEAKPVFAGRETHALPDAIHGRILSARPSGSDLKILFKPEYSSFGGHDVYRAD
ncbi:MAG: bifunctional diaminohydroxyphosphoribosylaminopyrimidine deaminase/5-amino-6-(5-phosphoribosylamino)uracil reductase RibD [Mailhella sp.]|nr:bifunctional diaminohydroxyphosphoribosylaminopyrimidine deaminase/5-amino-6-(5-phosphoribosylamino)uracil reductase RibD [Mailhella sp.]